jgi:hypothetical protein
MIVEICKRTKYPDGACYQCNTCNTYKSIRNYLAIDIPKVMSIDALLFILLDLYGDGISANRTKTMVANLLGDNQVHSRATITVLLSNLRGLMSEWM